MMSGAGFILAINLFVAGLLAASFMTIAAHDRRRISARWFALSYVIGMSDFLIEFAIATLGTSVLAVVSAFAALLAAMAVFNVGIARKYAVPAPWLTMTVVFVTSVAICYFIRDMPRQSFTRMLLYQTPYFIMQAIAVGIVGQAKGRSILDNLLIALLAASALQFLSKPFLFQAFGGTGASAQDYLKTNYALFSQSMGTIFAMAIALMLLVILVRDVLADATTRSEADMLSGLLNRGGFQARAEEALQDCQASWHSGLAGHRRPRPFQGGQRHVRPCVGRPRHRDLRRLPALGHGRAPCRGQDRRRGVRRYSCRGRISLRHGFSRKARAAPFPGWR